MAVAPTVRVPEAAELHSKKAKLVIYVFYHNKIKLILDTSDRFGERNPRKPKESKPGLTITSGPDPPHPAIPGSLRTFPTAAPQAGPVFPGGETAVPLGRKAREAPAAPLACGGGPKALARQDRAPRSAEPREPRAGLGRVQGRLPSAELLPQPLPSEA